jgi:predicted regulator of Ras-like GTPase activity (Roadblock/LC7/MglB family)
MNSHMNGRPEFDYIPSRLNISATQDRVIAEALGKLKKQAPARLVLLADRNGQTIFSSENSQDTRLVELAALLAGDLAASEEMARLMDSHEEQLLILREGQNQHSYLAKVGAYLALFVQLDGDVPLGWSRLIVQEAVQEIVELFANSPAQEVQPEASMNGHSVQESVNEALDNLWN